MAGLLELALIVVFDNPAAGALGPGEQFAAANERHCHTERILPRRRCVDEPRRRFVEALAGGNVEAAVIGRDMYDPHLGGPASRQPSPAPRRPYPAPVAE